MIQESYTVLPQLFILPAFRFKCIFRKGTLNRFFLGFIKQMLPMCVSMVTKYIQLAEMVSIDFMT